MVRGAGLRVVERRYAPNLTMTGFYTKTLGRITFLRHLSRLLDRWLTQRFPRLLAVQFILACERTTAATPAPTAPS